MSEKIPVFLHVPKNGGTYVNTITMKFFRLHALNNFWVDLQKEGKLLKKIHKLLVTSNGKEIMTVFVFDPFLRHESSNLYTLCNSEDTFASYIDLDCFLNEILTENIKIFSILIKSRGFQFLRTGLFELIFEITNQIPIYYTFLRDPFYRCQSIYNYIKDQKSIHEETHNKIKSKTFDEYLCSDELEDSWLIRELMQTPSGQELHNDNFEEACLILDKVKIKDINYCDKLINEVFEECYNLNIEKLNKLNDLIIDKGIEKNCLNKVKINFNEIEYSIQKIFLDKTKFDQYIYKKYCKNTLNFISNTNVDSNLNKIIYNLSTPIVLSAGIDRSGSTLMYNMIRLILREKFNNELFSTWIDLRSIDLWNEQVKKTQQQKISTILLKTHNLPAYMQKNIKHIFTCYRDVRTVMVSLNRFFNTEISFERIKSLIYKTEEVINNSNLCLKYNDLIKDPITCIDKISNELKININSEQIRDKCLSLKNTSKYYFDQTTLLFPNHMTNTKDEDWRNIFNLTLQKRVNKEFSWWFEKHGYPVD